ncbi:MAG: protein kinase [Sandaracinaceae bacterium]|nr:protein kinase [Sandaracinaceae bacterium]
MAGHRKAPAPSTGLREGARASDTQGRETFGARGATVPLDALPRLAIGRDGATGDFTVLDVIGEGGMGTVYLAEQGVLQRPVALKVLAGGARDSSSAIRLLREACVNGRLEHPGIVPVHGVGVDAELGPVVVMKRVRGRTWHQLLSALDRRDDAALAAQIETLLRVCDALDYAHAEGVFHRDLKPSNVMVGDFGEVYLLDWGVALDRRAPDDEPCLVGTPAYMAPEMTDGDADAVGPHTDVYLLGATLFEILFAKPPHGRGSAGPALLAAAENRIDWPDAPEVPEELVAICRRACATDPAARFESVAAFRAALRAFLDHRASNRVAANARAALDDVRAALEGEAPPYGALLDRLEGVRYGLRAALDLWPESPSAREGLRLAVEPLVRCHLELGDLPAARRLAAGAEALPPALLDRLDALERARADEGRARAQLDALARERDVGAGARERARLALGVVAALAIVIVITFGYRRGAEPSSAPFLLAMVGIAGAILAGAIAAFRRRLFATYANRQTVFGISSAFLLVATNRALGWLADVPPTGIVQNDLLLIAAAMFALTGVHRGFAATGALGLAAAVGVVLAPEWARVLINAYPIAAAYLTYVIWQHLATSDQVLVDRAARD